MNFKSITTGSAPSTKKKYVVVDLTRYAPSGSRSDSTPKEHWVVYEDTLPLTGIVAEFSSKEAALAHATYLTNAPNPE
ncbi:hypothetical protein [Xanthomonas campestris]|uniref:hypothetical protein n=1 Tax=Xanthomonas campestris TaxID=339 RepID=UPI002B23B87E|nr:hypothetical protein [Xanthomonas campestris]MEA9733974.1 hypothetical protein [Xanthomonas campestris pv. raphani]